MPDNYPIPLVTGCQKAVQDFVLQISIKDVRPRFLSSFYLLLNAKMGCSFVRQRLAWIR